MRKELFQEIEIPEGIEVKIDRNLIIVKGPEGEVQKEFDIGKLEFKIKDKKIIIGNKKSTKVEKKMMNTLTAHIKNAIKGVQEKFEYKLKVASSHFPMTVDVNGNIVMIKNFLGEKTPRKAKIIEGVEIDVKKDIITIKSVDKEKAGQTAANFEAVTKVGNRDKRIFQDGVYIIEKDGRQI